MPDHDDDLIAELRDLGAHLAVPEAADQRVAVRERLIARKGNRWRVWLAAAVAAVAVTVVAVEPARAAVIDAVASVLRIAGIEVERSDRAAPVNPDPSPLPSTGPAGLAEAKRKAPFAVLMPAALGPPERVELADPDDKGVPRVVSALYRGGTVRFDQFDGSAGAFFKQAGEAEWTDVGGNMAIWLPGPHTLTYVDRTGVERSATARLATPTLIWEQGQVTYRLEGFTSLDEARATATSLS
ncbi:hypothetical protein M1L60_19565 [Actinoplanes sp. TRM 88003]|uniref:DUF4367 domain-containing protein n=1 Tax=Paractinoplanes aksuensis TaxID=2939490 RepID=A0ABT1DPL6_9ACTN|nr:hypothetical protein [Actinoplanes aksuensis]MCO8272797.1 hypothetical protein [Actinoplanes aksuensis]